MNIDYKVYSIRIDAVDRESAQAISDAVSVAVGRTATQMAGTSTAFLIRTDTDLNVAALQALAGTRGTVTVSDRTRSGQPNRYPAWRHAYDGSDPETVRALARAADPGPDADEWP